MPQLSNARHEVFAQNIALGKSATEAYGDAGFVRNNGNASKLHRTTSIKLRVQELLEEKSALVMRTTAKEMEVTKDTLIAELEEARQLALDKNQPNAAVMATIGKARITGQIIDRREVGDVGAFDGLTDDELVAQASKKAKELGVPHLKLVKGVGADVETPDDDIDDVATTV